MGKLFGNLKSTDQMEKVGDRIGGGMTVPSGVYDATITLAYAGESASGAQNVTVVATLDNAGNQEIRETIYITNRAGENFYADKTDPSKKLPMPGFQTINDLCLLTTGAELLDQESEEKMVKIYDYTQRKEVPTPVPVLVDLIGKKVKMGVLRVIADKEKKDDSGNYKPTGETRTFNRIDKIFHAETGRTVHEYETEVQTPEFQQVWSTKNSGKDRDEVKKDAGAATGASGTGRPGAPGASQTPKKKLFGN